MTDLWQHLKQLADGGRPILLYGMGNGADKILTVCASYGIPVADFFASDGFVRGHSFHGKVVLSFTAACEKYGAENMVVLLSFASSRPEVLETIQRVADACELYVPDVPVCGTDLFNAAFLEAHADEIAAARALFADEESRRVYDGILEYKLTGRMDTLKRGECIGQSGNSGKSSGPHLHYEVIYKGRPVNPYNYYDLDMSPDEYSTLVQSTADASPKITLHPSHQKKIRSK